MVGDFNMELTEEDFAVEPYIIQPEYTLDARTYL